MPLMEHPQFGQVEYTVQEVSDDPEVQVQTTIELMRQHAIHGSTTPIIRQQAAGIAAECGPPKLAQVEAVWALVRSRLTFQEDSQTASAWDSQGSPVVEALLLPEDVAAGKLDHGDCDDFAVYAASLLTALGIPCSFVTIAANPEYPQLLSHVYVAAYLGSDRVAVDCSHGDYCGWESPIVLRIEEWPVSSSTMGGHLITFAAAIAAAGYYLFRKAA